MQKDLSGKVLGQLSIMQSVVISLPTVVSMLQFVCKGMCDIPGVRLVTCTSKGLNTKIDEPAGFSVEFKHRKALYGTLDFHLSSKDLFLPYVPYIENFCTMLAVFFDELKQRELNKQLVEELEERVAARTEKLNKEIQEHVKTQEALSKSEERLNLALEAANDGVWEWDLIADTMVFDQRIYDLVGFSRSDFAPGATVISELVFPDDLNRLEKQWIEVKNNSKDRFEVEFRMRRKCGGHIWIRSRGRVIMRGEHGEAVKMIGTHSDIDQLKLAEEKLIAANEELMATTNALIESNQDLELALVEAQRSRELELMNAQLILKEKELQSAYDEIIASHAQLEELNQFLEESNTEALQLNEELTSSNDQLFRQREELDNTLQNLKNAQAQLIQAEKMASIGVLTAGVAHELNNPLNFINAGISAIEGYLEDKLPGSDELLERLLKNIKVGVFRASEIIKSLNHFSRKSTDVKRACDVHLILKNCLTMTQHLLKNKIDLRTSYSAQPIWVQGNEGRLHQVFLNVLINAMQAIDKEGVIELATIVVDGVLELKVSDNGSGISVEHIEKIMDPFFTTKAPGEGTGLGLAIVYNILKDHGGSISYSSEVGAGTTATIRIPALVQLA